ncbi:hypothetical protein Glove_23g93 [Diversispora epigaea]|uniref:Uncharacterized protein n=1 Tax=Diversispora epigaea TaxID=1348612 RepID=A0A397JVE5_9GLOM|nr:hypothetical protein Glove_23g93 [Diversispora epigaea]
MLDAYLCAKLSNFKLSRREQDDTIPGLQLADAARYMAPEKIKDKRHPYTKECDILETPYASVKSFQKIEPVDENIPIKYRNIMKKAWDHNRNYRR